MDVRAYSIRRAGQVSNDFILTSGWGTINVLKGDVGDIDGRRVLSTSSGVDVEVALIQDDGLVSVLNVNILVGDVVDTAIANIRSSPGLETGTSLDSC
jgi:hypothetical protein